MTQNGSLGDSVSLLILGPWAQALGEIGSPLEALGPGIRGNRIALGGLWARINNDTEWLLRGFCVIIDLGPWAQALGEIGSPMEALGPGIRGNRIALGGLWARINNTQNGS